MAERFFGHIWHAGIKFTVVLCLLLNHPDEQVGAIEMVQGAVTFPDSVSAACGREVLAAVVPLFAPVVGDS